MKKDIVVMVEDERIVAVGGAELLRPGLETIDLVAVPGDPLADLGRLAHPSFVMIGGRRVPLELGHP